MGLLSFLTPRGAKAANPAEQQINTAPVEVREVGSHSVRVDMNTYLASDEKEWLNYLKRPIRPFRKPGVTLPEEYKAWQAERTRVRSLTTAAEARVN